MKVLIVTATKIESDKLIGHYNLTTKNEVFYRNKEKPETPDLLITGIGIVPTIYHLTKKLQKKSYDIIINAGIAGAFTKKILTGQVVCPVSEEFVDIGIETSNGFKTLFECNLMATNQFPFVDGKLLHNNGNIQKLIKQLQIQFVRAVTVNKTTGNESDVCFLRENFQAEIETMEGAAFFYTCLAEKVPFLQIRSISNYIGIRDKDQWNIPLAVKALYNKLIPLISCLQQNNIHETENNSI